MNRRVATAGLQNVVPIHSTEADPKLPVEPLDGVIMVRTYHEVEPYREMLSRIRSALRPGGRLVIVDAGPAADRRPRDRDEQVANHELDMSTVESEVTEARFKVVRTVQDFISSDRQKGEAMWLLAAEEARGEQAGPK